MAASATTTTAIALQRQNSSFIAVSPKAFLHELSSSEAAEPMTDPMYASYATSSLSSPSTSTSGDDEAQHSGRLSSVEGKQGARKGSGKRRYYLQLPTPPPSPFSAYSNGEPFPPAASGGSLPALPEAAAGGLSGGLKGRGGLFARKIEIAKRGSSRRGGPAGKAVTRGGLGEFFTGCFGGGEMIY